MAGPWDDAAEAVWDCCEGAGNMFRNRNFEK